MDEYLLFFADIPPTFLSIVIFALLWLCEVDFGDILL